MQTRNHVSTSDAAAALGCTTQTIVRMFKRKELEGFKVSPRIIRIYRDSVVSILEGANNEPNSTNA